MTETVCVHCGQPTRYSVGDAPVCKGGCRVAETASPPRVAVSPHAFVPQPRDSRYCNVCDMSEYALPEHLLTVTAPPPPPDEPEPEPKPKSSKYPWQRKR